MSFCRRVYISFWYDNPSHLFLAIIVDQIINAGHAAWLIASLLPLPPKPKSNAKEPERRLSRLDLARDLEKALGYVDEARYENARWWRNLNRMMSVLGVIILLAIVSFAHCSVFPDVGANHFRPQIALAVVATQMKH